MANDTDTQAKKFKIPSFNTSLKGNSAEGNELPAVMKGYGLVSAYNRDSKSEDGHIGADVLPPGPTQS